MKRLTEFGLIFCALVLVGGSLVLSLDDPAIALAFLDKRQDYPERLNRLQRPPYR